MMARTTLSTCAPILQSFPQNTHTKITFIHPETAQTPGISQDIHIFLVDDEFEDVLLLRFDKIWMNVAPGKSDN